MFRSLKYLFILLSPFFLLSCTGENPIGPSNGISTSFIYPDSTGNYWFYNYKNIVTNFSNDSIRHYFDEDTLSGSGISRFNGDTTINDISYKIYSSEHIGGIHGQAHNTTEYYLNTDTGFVLFAYRSTGTSFGPYRVRNQAYFKISGNVFYTIGDIYNYYNEKTQQENIDSLSFLAQPINCIRYPALLSPEWFLYNVSDIYKIYREYEGNEQMQVGTNFLSCAKITKKFYNFSTGLMDTNFDYTDLLSSAGLVKRDYHIKNIGLYNEMGKLIGYFDAIDEVQVVNYLVR